MRTCWLTIRTVVLSCSMGCLAFLWACGEGFEFTEKTLKEMSNDSHRVNVRRTCEPTALGTCFLEFYRYEDPFLWFDPWDMFFQASMSFHNADLEFLEENILLAGLYSGEIKGPIAHVIIPVGRTRGLFYLTHWSSCLRWDSVEVSESRMYSVETFRSKKDYNDFGVHYKLRDEQYSGSFLYILDAQSINVELSEDRVAQLTIDWGDERQETILYLRLWSDYSAPLEVLRADQLNARMEQP